MEILRSRIGWSLFFTLLSVVLAYLISIPLALKLASRPQAKYARPITLFLDIIYSLPSFWIATLLMFLFCNPDIMNLFPSSGIMPTGGYPEGTGFFERLGGTIPYLILPTITYTYSSFAFLTGSLRASIEEILKQDYIRTAYAKGLSEKTILYKHAFRNALLPVITIFSHVFPFAIGGSVILESLFTIPGMGLTIFQSITAQDYPVIITVFLLTGFITMSGFLFSDILYSIADPRISITKKPN
ncbi:MAG: ABC transporter permease [Bacteroidetes bacterium]|nr:ABC transporter permease [Bacteroidota bacterium]